MAIFLTSLILIVVASLVTVSFLKVDDKEYGHTFLGAFVFYSIVVTVAQALSFGISMLSMFLFDFKPDSVIDYILLMFWIYCVSVLIIGAVKKGTK
ncbi:hypothetical protein [Salmonella enterica]|uniref:hypothetical protein n=1 Tax=Salmonella enterica TaxID=28901 RepID=UPI000D574DF5|nr:hypothetical protein [Salmonella enterica]PVO50910.1 hypothetical protein C4743_06215 [Salmonella enterica subsp. enterica serovar Newport]